MLVFWNMQNKQLLGDNLIFTDIPQLHFFLIYLEDVKWENFKEFNPEYSDGETIAGHF